MTTLQGEIRRAEIGDAHAIAQVFQVVWPNQHVHLDAIHSALQSQNHVAHVAVEDGQIVAFVDGFATMAANGQRRWEVDLLAVEPKYQGRGYGTQLVRSATTWARAQKTDLARGLVRIGNIGSEIVFQKNGFICAEVVNHLFVSSQLAKQQHKPPNGLHLVTVQTMSYTGLWIEQDFSAESLNYALARRVEQGLDVVGIAIPSQHPAINDLPRWGFAFVGVFRWWSYAF